MARYVLTKAFWTGQQKLRAGRIIAQTQGEAQPNSLCGMGPYLMAQFQLVQCHRVQPILALIALTRGGDRKC
jgi:hypothetical protein